MVSQLNRDSLVKESKTKSDALDLLFQDIPVPINIYEQGQYSTQINSLATATISQIAYPDKRASIEELTDMVEKDPVAAKCVAIKALRAIASLGNFTHNKKEIESFINSNLNTLDKPFKAIMFKAISCVINYGFVFIEFTLSPKVRGYQGQWRLARLNVLNPKKIVAIHGKQGKIEFIEYDNGDGKLIKIPYKKCLHIINNSGISFDEREIFGVGDGLAAINYYKLKKVVLTQLALATKNNSTGILHAKTPNTGRTILVDSKRQPIKNHEGKPIEVTKQIALNYQLQDLHKRDYIVTDLDVEINRIQVQNDERFWEYALSYIDRAIQMAYGVPVGIFDSGMSGLQNVGLSQNFKSIFDSTIYALTTLLKEELINKVVKRLLYYNFPFNWFSSNFGEFVFDAEENQDTINGRLSTISSLIASGILDQNDVEVIALIRKNLGLPALDEKEKSDKEKAVMDARIQKEVELQMNQMMSQLQMLQTQQQMQMIQNPPPAMPEEGSEGTGQEATEDYPEGT